MAGVLKTIYAGFEVGRNGYMVVRLRKQRLDETGKETWGEWHRFDVEPDSDLEQRIAATNASLEELGFPKITEAELGPVVAARAAVHTEEVVAQYAVAREERRARDRRESDAAQAAAKAVLKAAVEEALAGRKG